MNRRAVFIALVVGILGLFLLLLYQRRFETEASGGEKVKLVIAVKQIDRGKVIVEDMITTREVPLAYVEDRAIKEKEKNKILGLRVGNTVKAQQTLMWTDIVTASEERRELSSLVLPGMRAVSIRAAKEDSSVALIRPGDYVDVIGVLGGGAMNEAKSSVLLLQRVLVLATGADTSPDQDQDSKDRNVDKENLITLSLTITEAQILALAAERGRIAVAVRHPDDQQRTPGIVDINFESILDPNKRSALTGVRRTGPVNLTAPPPGGQ